ncbi:allophanate hydrolase [Piscinibacter sp. XHJ-5]|uniref:allophanate hydrolase n=1 Tax=Piscinibacter sp. XHJ-5 TaxID=3037797 RepID=UPI0032987152
MPITLADWQREYRHGADPSVLVGAALARLSSDDPAWIHRCDRRVVEDQLARLQVLPRTLPLWGVPFAVKDNIDVAGVPTTAACPAFAYVPERHATVVQRLLDAGAVMVGKTNLDQFATGLVGTRSPYGEVPNSFDPAYVSGGSSSGSASVVARGLVPFALGTDTAGSGRVPAGFNNLVGLKPTPGLVPMGGVLPACRTLDVVSVFALTVADAARVTALMGGPLPDEACFHPVRLQRPWFGRTGAALRVGVPLRSECDAALGYERAWQDAVERLATLGAEVVAVDMNAWFDVAELLYDGPWVAERHAVVQALIESRPEALDPTVREVIARAQGHDATAAFRARYRLEEARARIAPAWQDFDVLMVPTATTCPTRAAVAESPVARNSELGRYTNFVNLLDLSALALPAGITARGLPFGITFIAPGGCDAALVQLALRWEAASALPLGARLRDAAAEDRALRAGPAAGATVPIAVVGAHLSGMPLHGQIVERGCRLLAATRTAPHYRLHALAGTSPPKPGLARVPEGGSAIAVEVYEMPLEQVGSFLTLIPPPLGLGSVELAEDCGPWGRWVKGFICEPHALAGAPDVSRFGGWRAYVESTAR